jgi:hypothetical protein
MRVIIHHSKFYDWDPVPKDVVITDDDIAAGKVMPNRDGSGYRMRVVKIPPGGTHRTVLITEGTLIEKIIEEKSDIRKAGRTLTRHQAAAALLMDQILPGNIELDWITRFEVEADDGPSEELMRAKLDPHTKADHGRRRGRKNVPPEHVEDHVAAYLKDWSPHPKAAFKDAKKPTEEEVTAHGHKYRAAHAANCQALTDHLHQHFGVKP